MASTTRIYCADSNYLVLATAFKRGDNMLGKAVRGLRQARSFDKRDFGVVKRWQIGFSGNRGQVGRHHLTRQHRMPRPSLTADRLPARLV